MHSESLVPSSTHFHPSTNTETEKLLCLISASIPEGLAGCDPVFTMGIHNQYTSFV
jgi:hypothetical protein